MIMGCAISKLHSRIIDSTRFSTASIDIKIINKPHCITDLYFDFGPSNHHDNDNQQTKSNPKCIFIFGM